MAGVEQGCDEPEAIRWARSGAMALTGSPLGAPRLTPWALATGMDHLAARFAEMTTAAGRPVVVDGPALLGERAACAGFRRQGGITVGGAGRMIAVADGWVVLQLARDSDWELLGALTGAGRTTEDWAAAERDLGEMCVAEVVEIGRLLGMAVAGLGPPSGPPPAGNTPMARRRAGAERGDPGCVEGLRVLDLSALWAGPLCANLLGLAGARVTKVEDPRRADGARRGARRFYELLHAGHRTAEVEMSGPAGRDELVRLIEHSDVVIEASRPRALDQLGIDREQFDGPLIWLSITAHGRCGDFGQAIGFGDDAAVAAGAWLPGEPEGDARPHFVADALADPVTGLTAAVAVLDSLARGGGELLDVSLSRAVGDLLVPATESETANVVLDEQGRWIVDTGRAIAQVASPRARQRQPPGT